MPKRRRAADVIPHLLAGGHVWTPESVFHETSLSYAPSDTSADLLFDWNRAVVLGGKHYEAWRQNRIAPIERSKGVQLLQRWPGLAEKVKEQTRRREAQQRELEWRRKVMARRMRKERERQRAERDAILIEEQRRFFEALERSGAGEDAIRYVQEVLGCDRETAWKKIIQKGFG